ncbi:hypothetical protein RI054_09g46170 [Pseudoscourfieldia marina]
MASAAAAERAADAACHATRVVINSSNTTTTTTGGGGGAAAAAAAIKKKDSDLYSYHNIDDGDDDGRRRRRYHYYDGSRYNHHRCLRRIFLVGIFVGAIVAGLVRCIRFSHYYDLGVGSSSTSLYTRTYGAEVTVVRHHQPLVKQQQEEQQRVAGKIEDDDVKQWLQDRKEYMDKQGGIDVIGNKYQDNDEQEGVGQNDDNEVEDDDEDEDADYEETRKKGSIAKQPGIANPDDNTDEDYTMIEGMNRTQLFEEAEKEAHDLLAKYKLIEGEDDEEDDDDDGGGDDEEEDDIAARKMKNREGNNKSPSREEEGREEEDDEDSRRQQKASHDASEFQKVLSKESGRPGGARISWSADRFQKEENPPGAKRWMKIVDLPRALKQPLGAPCKRDGECLSENCDVHFGKHPDGRKDTYTCVDRPKIILGRWPGRLGNRMFAYAYGREYAHIFGYDLYLVSHWEGTRLFKNHYYKVIDSDREFVRTFMTQNEDHHKALRLYNKRQKQRLKGISYHKPSDWGTPNGVTEDSIGSYKSFIFSRYNETRVASYFEFSDLVKSLPVYKEWEAKAGTYDIAHLRRDDIAYWRDKRTQGYSVISKRSYMRAFQEFGTDNKTVLWATDDKTGKWGVGFPTSYGIPPGGWAYPEGEKTVPDILFPFLPDMLRMYFARKFYRANSSFSWWIAFMAHRTRGADVYSPVLHARHLFGGSDKRKPEHVTTDFEFVHGTHPHWMCMKWDTNCGDIVFGPEALSRTHYKCGGLHPSSGLFSDVKYPACTRDEVRTQNATIAADRARWRTHLGVANMTGRAYGDEPLDW